MASSVTFLGVRGSYPCPDPDKIVYGGNTACVEVRFDNHLICIDAGTGIKALHRKLCLERIYDFHTFISHLHWDHVSGLPTFLASLDGRFSMHIYAGLQPDQPHLRDVMADLMKSPFFPVPVSTVRAKLSYNDFTPGNEFVLLNGAIRVQTAALNHPNGATGYAFTYKGKRVAYISDTEHFPQEPDPNVLKLMQNADLAIYDAAYTNDEYARFAGWGHSTWEVGVDLAQRAKVKKLALFHHAPDHSDSFLADIEKSARKVFPNAFAAKENTTIIL